MQKWMLSMIAAALCLMPGTALGAGLSTPNVGTAQSGPATGDPAAVWWNPAMLSMIKKRRLLVGGDLLIGNIRYERERRAIYQRSDSLDFAEPIEPENIDPSKTGRDEEVRANPIAPAPSLFLGIPFGERVVFGFGMYAPYAAILNFDDEGAQRFQLQDVVILTTYVTPSMAVKINDSLSFGAGISYVFGFASLSKIQDFAAIEDVGRALENEPIEQSNDFGPDAPPSVRELDVMARPVSIRRAIAHSATFNAGLRFQPNDRVLLGASYQHSAPMTFVGDFTLDMDDDFFTQDLESKGLAYDPLITGKASVSFPMPRSAWLAGSWQITPKFGVSGVAGVVTWSQVEEFDVRLQSEQLAQPELGLPATASLALPRDWKNSLAIELTGMMDLPGTWSGWTTVGYNSSASPDHTVDVASPDGDRVIVNGGLRWDKWERLSLIGNAEVQRILTREVVGSDYDLGNGTYNLTLGSVGLYADWRF